MSEGLRLDKWLWQARFAKTRSLAARLIDESVVLLDGRAVKASHLARVGNRVSLRFGGADRVVEIRALGERRGPAAEARRLYEDVAIKREDNRSAWVSLIED